MAYVSKTWVDRDSQYPTRRIIVHPDLTEEQVTVRRDEGIVTTQGDVFDANTMNNLEARIAAGIREKSILAGLDDTDISSPQNGQALIYDAASSKWVNANGGSGSATLAGLTDVTLTTPTADQVLKYDGTKWVNGEGGGDVELSKTVSGSVCSFSDGADGLPVKDLVAQVVAVQEGTGDPSAINIRPISGFLSVNLNRTGKNFFTDANASAGAYLQDSGEVQGGTSASGWTLSDYIEVESGGTYYFNPNTTSGGTARHGYFDSEKNFISAINSGAISFTTPSNAKYMRFSYRSASTDIQLELGNSASPYEPYVAPLTVIIALGQTVYGAQINVTHGTMKITHGYDVFDGDSITQLGEQLNVPYARVLASAISNRNYDTFKCNSYIPTSRTASGNIVWAAASQNVVRIFDDRFTDLATAQAILNAQPVQLVYELATPIIVQLTPTELQTVLGTNRIWADSGDTTVTYRTETASQILDVVQENTGVEELNDVSVSNVSNGQVLKYNSTSQKWENANESGGGGGAVIDDTTTSTTSVWSSSKTNSEIEATAAQILVAPHNEIRIYYPNELCIYGGHLYQCRVQNQGVFDPSDWVQTHLAPYIGQMVDDLIPRTDIGELSNVNDGQAVDGQVLIFNDGSWNSEDIPLPWTEVSGTLSAGSTSITLNSSAITANSTIQCFYGADDVDDPSKSVSTGSITLTFSSARQADLAVKVRVS